MLDVQVTGLIETKKNIMQAAADLHGEPMLRGMRKATLIVEGDAKRLAPVDTGRLRSSIASEVRVEHERDVVGVVGSNVFYAPYMELGTRPHFPPIAALEVWARRHGTSAFLVARAISRRGTKPRKFLQGAFEKNRPVIIRILNATVSDIVHKANNG